MIIDKELIFSDDQDIGQVAGDYDSTVEPDHVVDGGPYKQMFLFVKISEAVLSAGAATVAFALHTSNDGFSSDDDILWSSGAIGKADLTVNTVIARIPLPLGVKQDLKMVYTIGVATTTAGTVYSALVGDVNEGF